MIKHRDATIKRNGRHSQSEGHMMANGKHINKKVEKTVSTSAVSSHNKSFHSKQVLKDTLKSVGITIAGIYVFGKATNVISAPTNVLSEKESQKIHGTYDAKMTDLSTGMKELAGKIAAVNTSSPAEWRDSTYAAVTKPDEPVKYLTESEFKETLSSLDTASFTIKLEDGKIKIGDKGGIKLYTDVGDKLDSVGLARNYTFVTDHKNAWVVGFHAGENIGRYFVDARKGVIFTAIPGLNVIFPLKTADGMPILDQYIAPDATCYWASIGSITCIATGHTGSWTFTDFEGKAVLFKKPVKLLPGSGNSVEIATGKYVDKEEKYNGIRITPEVEEGKMNIEIIEIKGATSSGN